MLEAGFGGASGGGVGGCGGLEVGLVLVMEERGVFSGGRGEGAYFFRA
jgi:hypothetical protein